MARFMRLDMINPLLDIGLVPLFYNGDVETSVELVSALSRGGAKVIEITNRRKILYMPGCATENEIVAAEELGAKICKIFPGSSAGGPAFIKAVLAPSPWHRLMPTGGVDATEASLSEWIRAGAAAVGMGSNLITSQAVRDKEYDGIAQKASDCNGWIKKAHE